MKHDKAEKIYTLKMRSRNFIPFPDLKTERLILRQLTSSDDKEIFALRSDDNVNKYLDREPSKSIDDARKFIQTINENIQKNNSVYWAIILNGTDKLIGTICLFGFSNDNLKVEIGYELLPGFQGQGIMKEAVAKVIDYAFNTLKVQKIEAFFDRNNQGSIKLLEKFSFWDSNEPDKVNPDLVCYHLTNSIVAATTF